MKRSLWIVALGSLALLLVGCGTTGSDAPPTVNSPDDVLRIGPQEAKAMLDAGEAVLYDARTVNSYRTEHAAGAVSLPEEEVSERFESLPEDKVLIFYCT